MSLLVLCQAKKRDHLQMAARLRKAGKKECTPQEVLLAIDDMFYSEEDLESDIQTFKSTVFDSKAIYEEVITQELTEMYEYFNLKELQMSLQIDSEFTVDSTLSEVYIRRLYTSFNKKSTMLSNQG